MRLAFAILLPCLAIAQVKSFEVATVKPAARGPLGLRRVSGERVTLANYPLLGLIHEAYGLDTYRIVGGPGWLNTDRFDIAAVVTGEPTNVEINVMLQALLADRFALKVHRETKEGKVYELVTGKSRPKLTPAGDGRPFVAFGRNGSVDQDAVSVWIEGKAASMALFAARLSSVRHC